MSAEKVWTMCIVFYFDSYIIPIGCADPPFTHSGTEVVPLIPSRPASYMIGVTVDSFFYGVLYGRGYWFLDASATVIEDCYGFCDI
jgi:hypothetical protein